MKNNNTEYMQFIDSMRSLQKFLVGCSLIGLTVIIALLLS